MVSAYSRQTMQGTKARANFLMSWEITSGFPRCSSSGLMCIFSSREERPRTTAWSGTTFCDQMVGRALLQPRPQVTKRWTSLIMAGLQFRADFTASLLILRPPLPGCLVKKNRRCASHIQGIHPELHGHRHRLIAGVQHLSGDASTFAPKHNATITGQCCPVKRSSFHVRMGRHATHSVAL